MRCRLPSAAALVLCAVALPAAPAAAHQGNPNFRSIISKVTPQVKGVSLQVLNLDDRLELTNNSGQTVIAYGYNKTPPDPYVRILGDGTVQVNRLSPSAYINSDRYGGATTPAFADPKAPPQWKTVDKTGRYEWHDHRIHYMAKNTPPQVKDKGKRTKIFDWKVPIAVGATKGDITGQLFWQPKDDSGPPVGAIVGVVLLLGLGGAAVLVTRRRRAAEAGLDGRDHGDGPPAAGPGPQASAGEAW
jgi:hypothetical protein